jgi:3-oxoacyl-[acyl-carrier-protein] synthase-3
LPKYLKGSRIIGSGHFTPERILTNFDLEKIVETSDDWIQTRTGIRERRIVDNDMASSDLAYGASVAALQDAGLEAADLDAIILGTVTPDMQFPSTACILQDRLGAKNAVAFDVSAACSGFIFGLNTAHGLISSSQMKRILVVGVEVLSKFVDWTDRSTCVLFGDGAGAVVLEACDYGEGVLGTYMKSDGALAELLWIPAGGSREPISENTYAERGQYIKMKGDGVFKYAVRAMVEAAREVLTQGDLSIEDIDILIPHQANIRIIDSVVSRLKIEEEKVIINIDRFGNTSSATIPIAFDEIRKAGRIKPGDTTLFVAFGGGFTWGSVLFRM